MVKPKSHGIRRIEELHRFYNILNDEQFAGALPDIIITPVFKLRADTQLVQKAHRDPASGLLLDEIQIHQEVFNRGIVELCIALTHEMIHIWQLRSGNDKPKQHNHNKEWVNFAIELGFASSEPYGRTLKLTPTLKGAFMQAVNKIKQMNLPLPINATLFVDMGEEEGKSKDRNLPSWECPQCGAVSRHSPSAKFMCVSCRKVLVRKGS